MEIVATTIRVHEYTVRRALASPKHCSAENKHRFCFFAAVASFSNCRKPYRENSTFSWLSCQLSLAKQCIYTDGFHSWVIHFIWGDIFQHLGLDVRGALSTTSASLSLFKVRRRSGSLRALGHGYLSHSHTQGSSCTCMHRQSQILRYCTSLFIDCMNMAALPSFLDFIPKAMCKQLR